MRKPGIAALALASCWCVAVTTAVTTAVASPPTPLTTASSARPALTAVVGRTTSAVVYNDLSHHVVYLANPGGAASPRVFARHARALAVSGDVIEYSVGRARLWYQLGTGRHGIVPSDWSYLAPDGGMRIEQTGRRARLDYLHLDGSVQHLLLPPGFPTSGARYSVVAGVAGTAVAANTSGSPPKVAFSTLRRGRPFRTLNTAGLPNGTALTCQSVADTAVGCRSATSAVRLATNRRSAPQVITVSRRPLAVAVTDGYLSWTVTHASAGTSCPCDLASIDSGGDSVSIVSGLVSGALTAGVGRFFYSSGDEVGRSGVFVDVAAGGDGKLIAHASRRPLSAGSPVLGTGRAVWTDDSRASGAFRAHAVRHGGASGSVYRQATGALRSGAIAVSGPRSAYTGRHRALHVVTGHRNRVVGHGTLLGLSGTRLLFRNGHVRLLDLASGKRTDETAAHGAITGSIFGPYLSYVRRDGSVWRVDTRARDARPVRLSGPRGAHVGGHVYSWGDWTAWSVRPAGGAQVSGWRNARTLGTTHVLPAGRTVYGASVGGAVVARSPHSSFALVSWRSGRVRVALPGSGRAPSVDGESVGWLRGGVPTVAPVGVTIRNRPQLLGARIARHSVARGHTWRLELPTSAPLTRCSVTLRHGRYHRTLRCGAVWQSRGSVLVHWHTRGAPAGRYRWSVAAAGADGSVLGYSGGHARISGHVVVRA